MTRKCPYCAEEIQSEAVICRYCFKRVRGRHNRAIIIAVIIALLAVFTYGHKKDIRVFVWNAKLFFNDVYTLVKAMPEGMRAMSTYNKRSEQVEQVMNNSVHISE